MKKYFCDLCGKEVVYDDSHKCNDDAKAVGLNVGEFGAELFKVIKVDDFDGEGEHLYASSYQADLCRDCQTKLNFLVNQFVKGYEKS